ncbi:histidine kinase [Paraphotobacterium marinum]|uniref:Histidine kinase n=1 Tax=Paraphotobacterium marinum TaxID=1755811 RepID=A0A220VDP2_9GAMM|nr:alpha/beta fold hydrolase [Paraphotobacterium marinum]ASK78538.1 histidine kinase [Paraphotobacterium marinum]
MRNNLNLSYNSLGESSSKNVIIFIHGLFGDSGNLRRIATHFSSHSYCICVDVRNHGNSFHSITHDYDTMAEDILQLMKNKNIESAHLIGHSMGGKVALKCASLNPKKVQSLVIIDIAPISYKVNKHKSIFEGLLKTESILKDENLNRSEIYSVLNTYVKEESISQFLLKSLVKTNGSYSWKFNLKSLSENYSKIMEWTEIKPIQTKTLFIKGNLSDYILPEYSSDSLKQVPNSKIHIIANAGHWVHAEYPVKLIAIIEKFYQYEL